MRHHSIRNRLAVFLAATFALPAVAQPPGKGGQPPQAASRYLIVLYDYSDSTKFLQDETQALALHWVQLADLAGSQEKIAVIFFGGGGVNMVGENGMPTSAYRTLQNDLLRNWPKPEGLTPMDEAFEQAVHIVAALPKDAEVTVLLFTDGQPDSGRLRPEAFPAIKAEIDRRLQAVQEKYKDFDPAIAQKYVGREEQELRTPGTEKWQDLYKRQVPAEFKKTLEHAAALQKAGVRFVTVDYLGGIPELKEIHEAAGGKTDDLVLAHPASTAFGKLHARGLTALPNVLVQKPVTFDLDPSAFERTYSIKLDPVGDRALVTLVFEPGIAHFDKLAVLEARVGGAAHSFTPSNDDPACTLGFDNTGNVVTAQLALDPLPPDGQVTITYRSPSKSLAAPACTAYVHLRLSGDLAPEFRPSYAAADAPGPFTLTPTHPVQWVAALRSRADARSYSVKGIEALLRPVQHNAAELRIAAKPDSQAPHVFVSDAAPVPRGTYDVDLYVVLDSGAQITLRLPRHVQSQDGEECLTLEITQQGDNASCRRGQPDFGEVGDERAKATVEVFVRSLGVDYPVTVEATLDALADDRGASPKKPWVTAAPRRFTLQPGRTQRLLLTLQVPDQVEEEILDGPFQAFLNFTPADAGGDPYPVKRFQRVSGVPDDEPVNRVTFSLKRPRLRPSAPRCFRNTLRERKDGAAVLPLQISVAVPIRQTVTIAVAHDSAVPRQVTAFASAVFRDKEGKQLYTVRLTPAQDSNATQEVPPGGTGAWNFVLEVDGGHEAQDAVGEVELSAPGMAPVRVAVQVAMRRPLLGPAIQNGLAVASGVLGLLALIALIRYRRSRRFLPGAEVVVTTEKPLQGILALRKEPRGLLRLIAQGRIRWGFQNETRRHELKDNRPLPVVADKLASDDKLASNPLVVVELTADGDEAKEIALREFLPDPPELRGEVVAAPEQARRAGRLRRGAWLRFLGAAFCATVALTLFTPPTLGAAQWVIDLFTL